MNHASETQPSGASASGLIVPIGVALLFAIIGLAYAVVAAPNEEDRAAAAFLAERRSGLAGGDSGMFPQLGGEPPSSGPGSAWTYRGHDPHE